MKIPDHEARKLYRGNSPGDTSCFLFYVPHIRPHMSVLLSPLQSPVQDVLLHPAGPGPLSDQADRRATCQDMAEIPVHIWNRAILIREIGSGKKRNQTS